MIPDTELPPTDRDALLEWAQAAGIEGHLAWSAQTLAPHLPEALAAQVAPFGGAVTVADLATGDRWTRATLGPRLGAEGTATVVAAVRRLLAEAAAGLRAALAEEADRLEAPPPADPLLADLHGRLLALRGRLRAVVTPRPVDPRGAPRLHLDADAPALAHDAGLGAGITRVRLPLATWDTSPLAARCDRCGDGGCPCALTAVDAWLDRLRALDGARAGGGGDGSGDPAAPLEAVLRTPPWRRLLDALGDGPEAPPAGPLAWTVRLDGEAVHLSCDGDALALGDAAWPADRHAAEALLPDPDGTVPPGRVHRALGHLVGHPRVRLAGGGPVTVREGRASLVAVPRPGGAFALQPALDDATVPLDTLMARLEAAGTGGGLLALDAAGTTVTRFDLDGGVRRVLQVLHQHGALFPSESHDALLARVPALQEVMPVRLPASLKGEEMVADATPILRLAPVGEQLRVEARVRPVPGGPVLTPGAGPVEATGFVGQQRVWAHRDLEAEAEGVRALLATLPLPPLAAAGPFDYHLEGADPALTLVHHLERRGDEPALKVEWPRGMSAWRVLSPPVAALTLGVSAHRDWFGLQGGVQIDGEEVALALLLDAVRNRRRYVPVRGGLWLAIAEDLQERLAALAEHADEKLRVSAAAAPELAELLDDARAAEAPAAWTELAGKVRRAGRKDPPAPPGLEATLRPYQLEGFRWMARLAEWGAGAVLADDMGLGKTVQTLALMLHRKDEGPTLVLAPTSVCPNWVRECGRFAPGLTPVIYGAAKDREALLAQAGPGDVVIVSYGLMARDADRFAATRFATVVLDEAQAVKNPTAARARAARRLDAGFRLALTGTPVENHLGELWSLFSVVLPGLFGSYRRFRDRFVLPIERGQSWARREALARLVRPFVLRRTKAEVLTELPPRVDVEVPIRLSAPERRLYEETRLAAVARISGLVKARPGDEQNRFEILSAITRLRLIACHPRLHDPRNDLPSSKLARLMEIVDELTEAGHRALVFSQFTRHLKLVREALDAKGLDYLYLDGATAPAKRGQLVEAFQRGRGTVFLVSLKAGGTGLNLTAADHVIHLDPWWNPALEDQATDRAHRMGQKRSVTVLRLVARGTIEEAILELHRHKRSLLSGILDGAEAAASLSLTELTGLLEAGAEAFADDEDDADAAEARRAALDAAAAALVAE